MNNEEIAQLASKIQRLPAQERSVNFTAATDIAVMLHRVGDIHAKLSCIFTKPYDKENEPKISEIFEIIDGALPLAENLKEMIPRLTWWKDNRLLMHELHDMAVSVHRECSAELQSIVDGVRELKILAETLKEVQAITAAVRNETLMLMPCSDTRH